MDFRDNTELSLILTSVPPPYPYMSMMATGPGLAQVMPLLPWRSEKSVEHASYAQLSTTFVAQEAGTYWYTGLRLRATIHQHRYGAVSQHLLRLAAKQEPLNAAPAMRRHHNQVAMSLLCGVDNRVIRMIAHDRGSVA